MASQVFVLADGGRALVRDDGLVSMPDHTETTIDDLGLSVNGKPFDPEEDDPLPPGWSLDVSWPEWRTSPVLLAALERFASTK